MIRVFACLLIVICFCCSPAFSQNYAKFSHIKAGMKDYHLQQEALRAANKRGSDIRCREDYSKAVITSEDWEVERNDEGFIMGRHLHMELYGETPDGKCGVAHCILRQKMLGDDTYSTKLKLVEMGAFYSMMCE